MTQTAESVDTSTLEEMFNLESFEHLVHYSCGTCYDEGILTRALCGMRLIAPEVDEDIEGDITCEECKKFDDKDTHCPDGGHLL